MNKPLQGTVVLDLSQAVAGPCVSWLLLGLGARVIKLEGPQGDLQRWMSKVRTGMSPLFAFYNGGKETMTLNLKEAKGRQLFKQLVQKVDVVLENFVPGTMEAWELDYEVLKEQNPRLVYASITGFGSASRHARTPAVDMAIQAMSGIMEATGEPGGPPLMTGALIMDTLASPHLALGIVAALLDRGRTGHGQRVDVAMRDTAVTAPFNLYNVFFNTGRLPQRLGNLLEGFSPANAYRCVDGFVYLCTYTDKQARSVFGEMGRTDLVDDQNFATRRARWANRDTVDRLVEEWTRVMTRQQVYDRMASADVPCGMVMNVREVMDDPDLIERGVFAEMDQPGFGPLTLFRQPLRLDGELAPVAAARLFGQDNPRLYRELLSIDEDELAELRQSGIVPELQPPT